MTLQASGLQLVEEEILTQVFPYEFCKILKNSFFTEHFWVTASVADNYLVYLFKYNEAMRRSWFLILFWCLRKIRIVVIG